MMVKTSSICYVSYYYYYTLKFVLLVHLCTKHCGHTGYLDSFKILRVLGESVQSLINHIFENKVSKFSQGSIEYFLPEIRVKSWQGNCDGSFYVSE